MRSVSGAEQRAHRLQVGRDPRRAVDHLQRRQLRGQREARCSRSRARRSRARAARPPRRARRPSGGEPATSSPIRCAAPQSITSTHQSVARPSVGPRRRPGVGRLRTDARILGLCPCFERSRPRTSAATPLGEERGAAAFLRAGRGARRARLDAPAGRSAGRRRGRARARAAADRAAPGRPGARDPGRAPAQARHGRRRSGARPSRRRSRPRRASASSASCELHSAPAARGGARTRGRPRSCSQRVRASAARGGSAIADDRERSAIRARQDARTRPPPATSALRRETLRMMREEVLASVARIGGRLGELRLDTDLDISHGVVRYLELLKLAALLQRPDGQSIAEALPDINARLLAAATPLQREILQTSTLDETLLAELERSADTIGRWPARARSRRAKPLARAVPAAQRRAAWCCRPRTSRPTAAARCATSSRASCASRPSRRSTSASGSSSTRCSSATTPTPAETLAQMLELLDAAGAGAASATASTSASCARRRAPR